MGGVDTETKFHVLAVDDSIIDRKLIERLLKTSSYQVTVVESGVKAIEYLGLVDDENTKTDSNSVSTTKNHNEVEVNLIITDYSMPGITGYELLRKIKELVPIRIGSLNPKRKMYNLSMMSLRCLKYEDQYFICMESLNGGSRLSDCWILGHKMVVLAASIIIKSGKAAAAIFTAQCALTGHQQWSKTNKKHINYTEDQLMECAILMVIFDHKSGTAHGMRKADVPKTALAVILMDSIF